MPTLIRFEDTVSHMHSAPPGTTKHRFVPKFHYELIVCGLRGHEPVDTGGAAKGRLGLPGGAAADLAERNADSGWDAFHRYTPGPFSPLLGSSHGRGSFMLDRLSCKTILGSVLTVAAAALLAGCGSGGGKNSGAGTPSSSSSVVAMGARPSVTKAAIRQSWETFFDGSTPSAKRVALLEEGEQFAATIGAISSSPLAKQAQAQVSSVTIDGPEAATVTFSLLLGGTPVLNGVEGSAVLVDGTWKVSVASFCGLAALQGPVPKACPAAGK